MSDGTVSEIMTSDPVTIGPEVPVTDAAKLMVERRVGALPVLSEGRLVGIVTESDLIMQDAKVHFPTYLDLLGGYVFAPGSQDKFEHDLKKAVGANVEDVMTTELVTVTRETSVADVATLMVDKDVSCVPVLDGDELVGVVSKSDIVRHMSAG
jgi:CBS domain-containing protein